jgi:hypothetical protein
MFNPLVRRAIKRGARAMVKRRRWTPSRNRACWMKLEREALVNKAVLALLMLGGGCGAAAPQAEEKPGAAMPQASGNAAATAPAAAEAVRGVENPRAFIADEYAAIARDPDAPRDPVFAYSDRLRGLFAAYEAWTAEHGPLGALDFDWWTNSQDWVLSGLRVTEANDGPDRRIVSANFNNGDRPDQIRFLFVRQGGRWFLDDAVEGTGGGGEGWTLSDLLRERE